MLRRRRTSALAVVLFVSACDEPPTYPAAIPAAPRPNAQTVGDAPPVLYAQNLGVLPGDAYSRATHVGEDGVVYGQSQAEGGARRFFRWTQSGGMTQVSSIPLPSRPRWPLDPLPAPWANAEVYARNAKGEATGQRTWINEFGDPAFEAFRYSAGAGLRSFRRPTDEFYPETGWSINRWGHVAGNVQERPFGELRIFFWTPLDSVVVLTPDVADRAAHVNDLDQLYANLVHWESIDTWGTSLLWRPDLGPRQLGPTVSGCGSSTGAIDVCEVWVQAQQRTGTWLVGYANVKLADGTVAPRAMLWRAPAVNRAAFPRVNANPYGGTTSTVSLSANGGRYYQTYTATQATATGPYVEHIDWGDGIGSRRVRSSITSAAYQSHVYTKTGSYWVRVYIEDAQGRWAVSERKVVVVS